jgi:hypothetical protein
MNATTTRTATTTAANDAPTRAAQQHREAEYLALRQLADEVRRLDRQVQRERSYAALRYAS